MKAKISWKYDVPLVHKHGDEVGDELQSRPRFMCGWGLDPRVAPFLFEV